VRKIAWGAGWLLWALACTPDYGPLLERACEEDAQCPSRRCLGGYCALPEAPVTEPDLSPDAASPLDQGGDLPRLPDLPDPDDPDAPDLPAPEGACEAQGEPCDPAVAQPGGFACFASDALRPDAITCHAWCDFASSPTGCPAQHFCGGSDEGFSVCIRGNCTDPLRSEAECGALEPNGGTCFPVGDGLGYCYAAGARQLGQRCSEQAQETDCAAGLACVGGRCERFCAVDEDGDDTCGYQGRACAPLGDSPARGVCLEPCLPWDDETCADNRACLPIVEGFGYCRELGEAAAGQACAEDWDCRADLGCVWLDNNQAPACRPLCEREGGFGDQNCAGGAICYPWSELAGHCVPGCRPFTEVNGCAQPDERNCWPIEDTTRGACLPSGDVPLGAPCALVNGSVLGQCAPGGACVVLLGKTEGICRGLCRLAAGGVDCQGQDRCQDLFGDPLVGVCAELP
jgi:hypothetical protein